MEPVYINPKDIAHRSDTVVYNGVAYVAGVVPSDNSGSTADQARRILDEIDSRLAAAGTDKSRLLSATIWMVEVDRDFAEFNKVWNAWLAPGRRPARACVQAGLVGDAMIEVAVIAAVQGQD